MWITVNMRKYAVVALLSLGVTSVVIGDDEMGNMVIPAPLHGVATSGHCRLENQVKVYLPADGKGMESKVKAFATLLP